MSAGLEHARWATGGIAGASFVCLVTIVGASLHNYWSDRACVLLAAGIPLLLLHQVVTRKPEEHDVSSLMQWMPVLGVLCCVLGISLFVYASQPAAGVVLFVVSVGVLWTVMQSNERSKRKR
jgi:hypothetical protein